MSYYPEIKKMSEATKRELLNRFEPVWCPNCQERLSKVEEVQSSTPLWNIGCRQCGADYILRMIED